MLPRMSDTPAPPPETADFGFARVPRAEKKPLVRAVFEQRRRRATT